MNQRLPLLAIAAAVVICVIPNRTLAGDFVANGAQISPQVDFLAQAPLIDGRLDESIEFLPVRTFNIIDKSSPDNPDTTAVYRMAYGADFFYLYIEADGDKLNYRDRAFQYGDGFNLVLAKPNAENTASDEFYVLAGGAVKDDRLAWSRNIFWYHNVTNVFKRTSADTKVGFREGGGKISFELYLPWKDVRPYHPWLSAEGIGFNLKFNKAIGNKQEMNSLNVYDGEVWRENMPRDYNRLQFETPVLSDGMQGFAQVTRNHTEVGEQLQIRSVSIAAEAATQEMSFKVKSGEGARLLRGTSSVPISDGLVESTISIEGSDSLPSGGYQVSWRSKSSTGSDFVSILPAMQEGHSKSLEEVQDVISRSSQETLEMYSEEVTEDIETKRAYETAVSARMKLATIESAISGARNGQDTLANQRGYFRKGFRSRIDNTLQPYTVIIPENYSPDRTYPLVVFLHGSASDETDMSGARFITTECCIAVGPFGRGYSNLYLGHEPQTDILEAIEAVSNAYSVDRDNIVMTGFSMGGWGAIHTYASNPELFRALAVFSGPAAIVEEDDEDYGLVPNYLKVENQGNLADADVFISSGDSDNNVPIDGIRQFADMLEVAGARVVLRIDDRGHDMPNDQDISVYHDWLEKIVAE